MNHRAILTELTGIVGTTATITLSQVNTILSICCGLCTLVIVAPKALANIRANLKK